MLSHLRGDPAKLQQKIVPPERMEHYAKSTNGRVPGPGFFGEVYNTEDAELFSTELPASVFNVAGHMAMMIPMIVSTLNREELAHLVDGGQPTLAIVDKARRHAETRLACKLSVFAGFEEQGALPPLAESPL